MNQKNLSAFLCSFFMLCWFIVSTPAQAALFSGAYLLKICEREVDGEETVKGGAAACQAYIAGVIDYHNLLEPMGASSSADFCIPEDTTLNDLQSVVWLYLEGNKEHDAFIAAPAVVLALQNTFPCK